jgi:UDPglucose 6-dehydrogenase
MEKPQVFAIVGVVTHHQGQTPGTGILQAPVADPQFGNHMNQVRLERVAELENFPAPGKNQTALRRKGCFNSSETVNSFSAKNTSPRAILRCRPAIIGGKKSVLDILPVQIALQSGEGICYPVYFRREGIGKISDFHSDLPAKKNHLRRIYNWFYVKILLDEFKFSNKKIQNPHSRQDKKVHLDPRTGKTNMITLTILGTGYVGLVTGACLADLGNSVICVDRDMRKIEKLKKGEIPFYEPGLIEMVQRNAMAGRLFFSASLPEALQKSKVIFIAVGTPPAADGSADLSHVEQAAREIGSSIQGYKVIVNKSTTPVGTGKKISAWIQEELFRRASGGKVPAETAGFDFVSNPEFLREGSAIQEFMHPDRIVIGTEAEKAREIMKTVYRSLYLNETPFVETDVETAEMIKYAANTFLAVKISFINEVANLCEKAGANVQEVARAMGMDNRIGAKFLRPGPGYGGSCFPKDTRALARTGREKESPLLVVEAAIQANENQKQGMVKKIASFFEKNGGLKGKRIALLGLAFKPNTSDTREAPSLAIIRGLVQGGARIQACDPAAIPEAARRLADMADSIRYFADEYEAVSGCDALVIVTEWNQFRNLDLQKVRNLLRSPVLFDLRNIYTRQTMKQEGFQYFAVGQ